VNAAGPGARRLIVFARLPRLGRVKTRLAATVGAEAALHAYRLLLERTLGVVAQVPSGVRELRLAEGDPSPAEARWLDELRGAGWTIAIQHGDDLGDRMAAALDEALAQRQLPVLVGCDCPVLQPEDLEAAFDALAASDAVFSPTEDGGYALVGIRRPLPQAFASVRWGSDSVMATTRERLARQGASWAELRTLWDVDVEADLRRWQRETVG
jgi:uncharacterized protein